MKLLKVKIIRIGTVNNTILKPIQKQTSRILPKVTWSILENNIPTPKYAYNSKRNQFNSSLILSRMNQYISKISEDDRILGVTNLDIFVPHLNFAFGEAECPGKSAIVSLYRLKPEFYGAPPSLNLFYKRFVKEVIHEISHTLGFEHCIDPTCIMYLSQSIQDTDRKGMFYCKKCLPQTVKHNAVF